MTLREAVVYRAAHGTVLARRAVYRQLFLRRCALAALEAPGTVVNAHVHPTADIHPRVRVRAMPGTTTEIAIGPHSQLGELTLISGRGGQLRIGAGTDIRRLTTLHVGGRLVIGDGVVVSTGVSVHCSDEVGIENLTIIGEWSTLADSAHERTTADVPIHHATSTAPVWIGRNCWLGARVTVAAGVRVGHLSVVGSGAVVTHDVPDGWLAAGVPARNIRPLVVDESAANPSINSALGGAG